MEQELILGIIPARGGSKGVPRKNIRKLNGQPLIKYTIDAAKKSKYINKLIVSTDDREIAEYCERNDVEIPFLRPAELATDEASTVDVVKNIVNYMYSKDIRPKYIVLLQPTSPFRNNKHIDEAIEKLEKSKSDAIISVCEVASNPYWTMKINDNGRLQYFLEEGKQISRRQDLPKIYDINGAIYIIKTEVFIKEETFEPINLVEYIMSEKESIDIDEELDFKLAELMLSGEV